jgi:hypothetical protein
MAVASTNSPGVILHCPMVVCAVQLLKDPLGQKAETELSRQGYRQPSMLHAGSRVLGRASFFAFDIPRQSDPEGSRDFCLAGTLTRTQIRPRSPQQARSHPSHGASSITRRGIACLPVLRGCRPAQYNACCTKET